MARILIIEDEINLRNTLVDLLEINNYEVVIAQDGEEGVKKVIETNPDIVLCDVNMPKMNGFEVLDMLSHTLDELQIPPFIFLTAKTDRESNRYGMYLGAEDYITKPFNNQELLNALETRILKRSKFRQSILDNERTRISEELHNGVQNIIAAAGMGIKSLVNSKAIDKNNKELLERSSGLIDMALNETRNLSHSLSPEELEEKGLKKYIEKVISPIILAENIHFNFHSIIEHLDDKKLQLHLCRLIQEMITNTIKHANADKINLSIIVKNDDISIKYEDNGVGIDINDSVKNDGFKYLRQKAKELNGKLYIKSTPNEGIDIYFNIKK